MRFTVLLMLFGCPKSGGEPPAPVADSVTTSPAVEAPSATTAPTPPARSSSALDPQPGEAVTLVFDWSAGGTAAVAYEAKAVMVQGDVIANRTVTVVNRTDDLSADDEGTRWSLGAGEGSTEVHPPMPGGEAMQALMTALSTAPITARADAEGAFTGTDGLEAYTAQVQADVDAAATQFGEPMATMIRQQVAPMLDTEALEADVAAQWQALVGSYVGLTLDAEAPASQTAPDGATLEVSLLGWVSCDGQTEARDCVAVRAVTIPTEQQIEEFAETVRASLAAGTPPGAEPPEIVETTLEDTIVLVLEPGTLRPWFQEKIRRSGNTLKVGPDAPLMGLGRERTFTTTWSWQAPTDQP